MNTVDLIKKISLSDNVIGNENAIDEIIDECLKNSNLIVEHLNNRSTIIRKNKEHSKNLIVSAKDTAGFCLIPLNNRSFLLPLSKFNVKDTIGSTLLFKGEKYEAKASLENAKRCEELYIENKCSIGDIAKKYTDIIEKSDEGSKHRILSGIYISNYTLIAKMIEYSSILTENCDILLASQTHKGDFSIINVINKYKYKNVIFISASETDKPQVLLRSGKEFSSQILLDILKKFNLQNDLFFEEAISDNPIYTPISKFSEYFNKISFIFPIKDKDKISESVDIDLLNDFIDKISQYLKNIKAN